MTYKRRFLGVLAKALAFWIYVSVTLFDYNLHFVSGKWIRILSNVWSTRGCSTSSRCRHCEYYWLFSDHRRFALWLGCEGAVLFRHNCSSDRQTRVGRYPGASCAQFVRTLWRVSPGAGKTSAFGIAESLLYSAPMFAERKLTLAVSCESQITTQLLDDCGGALRRLKTLSAIFRLPELRKRSIAPRICHWAAFQAPSRCVHSGFRWSVSVACLVIMRRKCSEAFAHLFVRNILNVLPTCVWICFFFSLKHVGHSLLRHFGLWNISVICVTVVLKLAITVFFSLYFLTFWPKSLDFFRSFQKRFSLWPKSDQKKLIWMDALFICWKPQKCIISFSVMLFPATLVFVVFAIFLLNLGRPFRLADLWKLTALTDIPHSLIVELTLSAHDNAFSRVAAPLWAIVITLDIYSFAKRRQPGNLFREVSVAIFPPFLSLRGKKGRKCSLQEVTVEIRHRHPTPRSTFVHELHSYLPLPG